jgi:hypothetical protein
MSRYLGDKDEQAFIFTGREDKAEPRLLERTADPKVFLVVCYSLS